MRRQFYLAFAIVLMAVFLTLVMLHDTRWFIVVALPLVLIYCYDLVQKRHALLRNFPILGHIRYLLEFIRPEIQQYFIASDESERPFSREVRSLVYQRAKGERETIGFGSQRDITAPGYEWVLHSLHPRHVSEVEPRIVIGNDQCKQPYSSSRLNISGMSFGALSANAIMAMNLGAKLGGFAQATGEGGLSQYHLMGGDIILQIGTGYFGCRYEDGRFNPEAFKKLALIREIKMIELKLSQGAKPAHGGILPAAKLTPEIAQIRMVPLGKDVLSPPAHSAFSTPTGLLEFIQQLRELSGGKPVGFKLCLGKKSEFISICKAMLKTGIVPDFISIDGAEGGTGAAPVEFVNNVGTPLNDALIFIHNTLVGLNLRDKVRLCAAGKIATGFDMVSKIALGADVCNMARAMMLATGCIQSMQCNANTCPTGVATQDKRLQKGLVVADKKYRIASFHERTVHGFLELIGAMGLDNPSDLNPQHVMRRIDNNVSSSYAGLYEYLLPGDLLQGKIPPSYQPHFELASADKF